MNLCGTSDSMGKKLAEDVIDVYFLFQTFKIQDEESK